MQNRLGTIYKIENITNGKVYIGQTIQNNNRRKIRHFSELRNNNHPNTYLQNAFVKSGEENFKFEIIEKCDIKDLDNAEVYWISYYKELNGVYNLESGGHDNKIISEEARKKNSETLTRLVGKPVICLNTGEIFDSVRSAGRKYNLNSSSISKTCRGNFNSCGKLNGIPMQWKYYEEGKGYLIENIPLKRKKVICINTGEIFDCISEASEKIGVSASSISRVCNGKGRTAGKLNGKKLQWAFYEDGKKYELNNTTYINHKARKVICINTGEIFNTITEAEEKYNLTNISSACSGIYKTAGKSSVDGEPLQWAYYEEGKEYELKKIKWSNGLERKVICVNTGEVFNSISEATLKYSSKSVGNISNVCQGKRKHSFGYKWMYKEDFDRIKDTDEYVQILSEISKYKAKRRSVVQSNLEGELVAIYPSTTEAEKMLKIHNITAACTGKYKSAGGFKWMYKEDYDKMMAETVNQ